MTSKIAITALTAAALIGAAGAEAATPVGMNYALTGTSGNWTLNFDVSNDLVDSDQSVYFFGVAVDGGSVVKSPYTFDSTSYPTWDRNVLVGGQDLVYNGVWVSGGHVIVSGENLNGFLVHSNAIDAPTSVNWFAFSSGSPYAGDGYFNSAFNPGWEGTATAAAIPEPANLALVLAGLALFGVAAVRRAAAR